MATTVYPSYLTPFSGEYTGIFLEVLAQCIVPGTWVASQLVPQGLILVEFN